MFVCLHSFLQKIKFNKVLPVFLAVIMFSCTSLSSFAAVSPDASNEWFLLPFDKMLVGNGEVVGTFSSESGTYYGTVNGGTSNDWWRFVVSDQGGVFPTFNSDSKYLVYYTVSAHTGIDCGFDSLRYREDMSNSTGYTIMTNISNFSTFVNETVTLSGFCSYSIFDLNLSTGSAFYVDITTPCVVNGRVSWGFYALDVTEDSDDEINEIVTAINNQTSSIMNAGSGFGGTTSGIQSGNESLSGYIDQYTAIEQSMHDKFIETQTALNGEFTGFTWGSLSTCLNWVGDYMQQIYLNSGDFKMMIILPLLLGIALFLIGRGSLVYGEMTRNKSMDNKDFTLKD